MNTQAGEVQAGQRALQRSVVGIAVAAAASVLS